LGEFPAFKCQFLQNSGSKFQLGPSVAAPDFWILNYSLDPGLHIKWGANRSHTNLRPAPSNFVW